MQIRLSSSAASSAPLVNLERETVFRRFLKHLHLLCLRTSYSSPSFLCAHFLQRQHHRRRPLESEESLSSKDRDDGRRGFAIRSVRRHWLHSPQCAATESTSFARREIDVQMSAAFSRRRSLLSKVRRTELHRL